MGRHLTQHEHSVVAIIPARGGSKRIPRKNVVDVAGRPMIAWTIEAALEAGIFSEVLVSTEDDEIAAIAAQYGAQVVRRPQRLADDQARVVDVCTHVLEERAQGGLSDDVVCLLLPSAPLRNGRDIQETYAKMRAANASYAMAATSYLYPPWQALKDEGGVLTPFWGAEMADRKSQEMPQLVVDAGAVYFARVQAFLAQPTFYGPKVVGHHIPNERALDVDEPFQLHLARLLARERGQPLSTAEVTR